MNTNQLRQASQWHPVFTWKPLHFTRSGKTTRVWLKIVYRRAILGLGSGRVPQIQGWEYCLDLRELLTQTWEHMVTDDDLES